MHHEMVQALQPHPKQSQAILALQLLLACLQEEQGLHQAKSCEAAALPEQSLELLLNAWEVLQAALALQAVVVLVCEVLPHD